MKSINQVVAYDGYWRCQAKRCSRCGNTRPVGQFNRERRTSTGYSSACKSCYNAGYREALALSRGKMSVYKYRQKRSRNPELARRKALAGAARNRNRLKALHGDNWKHYLKQRAASLEQRRYGDLGKYKSLCRDKWGRALIFYRLLIKKFGRRIAGTPEIRAFMKKRKVYASLFDAWKDSGYAYKLAPCLYIDAACPKPSLSQAEFVTCGQVMRRTNYRGANGRAGLANTLLAHPS